MIDERAIIDPSAKLADDVNVGPYAYIGADVELGPGCQVDAYAIVKGPSKFGANNHIYHHAIVGEEPQTINFSGEDSYLEVGDNNIFREFCTIHRGTKSGGCYTRIGNNNFIMAYVHIAHDCMVGNNSIFANSVSLAGHVTVQDNANFGGIVGVHQYVTIGSYCFVGGGSMVRQDVLPYILVAGHMPEARGLNLIGLKRSGFSQQSIRGLRDAYNIIFRQQNQIPTAIEKLQPMVTDYPEVQRFIDSLQSSERGITR